MARRWSSYVYFTRLMLSNVKALGEGQVLDLCEPGSNQPSQWTLILGDNGVGKTTLLQCIALMRPILAVRPDVRSDAGYAPRPDWLQPALAFAEDGDLIGLARVGKATSVRLEADLLCGKRLTGPGGRGRTIEVAASIDLSKGKLKKFKTSQEINKSFTEPLVVAYSAARHMAFRRGDPIRTSEDETAQLFEPDIQLEDAEDVLERLDYARARGDKKAGRLLSRLKTALAKILPDVRDSRDIKIYPPATPASLNRKTGVRFVTPYGEVRFRSLSLGYQTVAAWTADLTWKLFEHFPASADPLQEPAVVLIDELDLHLHPHWQRNVRKSISESFPQVQFIATAHSPLIAQTYLDTNIVVLLRRGNHVEIENDPAMVSSWGVDDVVTSELFGLTSPFAPEIDALIRERKNLLKVKEKDQAQRRRLDELDQFVSTLPTEADPRDQAALDRLRSAASLLGG
jgi:energy-coupling factor transporter ATP-binding protein EcfA2